MTSKRVPGTAMALPRLRPVLPILLWACPLLAAPGPFDRRAWMKDFEVLKARLEEGYSHLAWFASPQGGVDLPALVRRTRRALETAEGDADAKAALVGFVSGFPDGHLRVVADLEPARGTPLKPPPAAYDAMDAASAVAALGYAPATSVAFSLPFEGLKDAVLQSDGVSQPFRSALLTTGKGTRIGILRIPRFREQDGPPVLAIQALEAQRKSGRPLDPVVLRESISETWFRAFAERLQRLRAEGAAAVIVDVGGNGGGNDSGDWMTRLLTPREVHSARLLLAASPAATQYFDEQIEGLRAALKEGPGIETALSLQAALTAFEARKSQVASRRCELAWVWKERRAWNPSGASRLVGGGYASGHVAYAPPTPAADRKRAAAFYWAAQVDGLRGAWDGPVYVLADGRTGSSAEMFAATLRDNGVAKVVGGPTAGAGAGFMIESAPVELPHSHLRIQVPNCVRLRADGSDEVAGIAPDLPVFPREGESVRARAARVLEAVEADLLARPVK